MIREYFKNARWIAAAEIVVKLKALVLIPLLTRHFGAVNYGVWSQILVLVGTVTPLVILGTDSAFIRFMPGRPLDEQKRAFSGHLTFLFCLSIVVCSLIYFFKRQIASVFFGGGEYELFIPLAAATIFVGMLLTTVIRWFRIHNNAKVIAAVTVSQALLGVLAVLLILLKGDGVYRLVTYTIIADIVIVIWLLMKITRDYGWAGPAFSGVPGLLKFGLPLVPASFAMWGLNSMDRLFLVKYSTLEEIGVYAVAYSMGFMVIPLLAKPFRAMYNNSAAELYNKNDLQGLQRLFNYSAGTILVLTVPASIGLFVVGEPLLSVLTTKEFLHGAPVIAIVACGYVFHTLANYYNVELGLVLRQHWVTVSILAACGVNLILNFLLIPAYSILGAAIATNLAFLTELIISFLIAGKYRKLTTDFSFVWKTILAAAVMGAVLYSFDIYLSSINIGSIFKILVLIFTGTLIYVFCLVRFKIVSREMFAQALQLTKFRV